MNDNSLGIREARNTVAASELDVAMQPFIDSGDYTKEELEKIRKRKANEIRENKAPEVYSKKEELAAAAKTGPTNQVEAFNKEIDKEEKPEILKPTTVTKQELEQEEFSGKYGKSVDIFDIVGLYKEKKQSKLEKNTAELDKKHEELGTQQKFINQYGTSDRDEILAITQINDDGTLKSQFDEHGNAIMFKPEDLNLDRDDKTYLNPNDLPMFDDEDMMEYLYAPYMEDAETMYLTVPMDFIAGIFGADTDYATPENERQKKVFQDRFFSSNVDRSGILNYIKAKQSNSYKEQFDTDNEFGEGLEIQSNEYANVAQLAGKDKDTFDLIQAGRGDEAAQLNEDNGFYTLYNKDGKYINWSELSDEDKANADPNNVSKVSKEDEERAIILSERHKPATLQIQQTQNRHDLVAAVNMYRETHGESQVGLLGLVNWSSDDFNNAIISASDNNSLIGGLQEASGDDEVTQHYNEALKKYLITGRALELNQDLSKLAEEGSTDVGLADVFNFSGKIQKNIGEFLFAPDKVIGYTADEQAEAFGEYMEEIGVVMNDDWKRVTREGGDWMLPGGIEMFGDEVDIRDIAEGGRDFVKHIAPLIASLYITKRIPLGAFAMAGRGAAWGGRARTARTLGGQVSKKFTAIGNYMKKLPIGRTKIGKFMTDITLGGVEELVYLSIADQVGGSLFNMDPMVYDPKTDELNWEFAFGLGVGNVVGKKIIGRLMQSKRGSMFMSRVSRYSVLEKAFERGMGAVSGVGSMEIAKAISGDSEIIDLLFQDNDFTKYAENGFESEVDYRKYIKDQNNETKASLVKTMASDFVGMFMLGYITPGGKVGEALAKDIDNFNIRNLNTSKAAKKLSIKENVDADVIDAAANKKKVEATKKWLKSKKTEKDAKAREKELAEIEKAASDMNGRLHIRAAKKLISKDKKRLAELERQLYVINKAGGKLTPQQMLDLGSMNKAEFDYLMKKMKSPEVAEFLTSQRDYYKGIIKYVKSFGNITSRSEALKLMTKTKKYFDAEAKLERLKNDKGANNGAKIELAKLELEPIKLEHTKELAELKKKYEEAVNKELLIAKAIAESLGAEFEIAESTEDYLRIANDPAAVGTAGFHYTKNGKSYIVVDPVKAAEFKTIGTGIHETVHHILKDAFKENYTVTEKNEYGIPVKVTKQRISRKGVAIIDKFLESLSEKDRKFLKNEMIEREYSDRKTVIPFREGVESYEQKSKYYEEILTTYVEGLKNKQITLDLSRAEKIQNVFLPHINKVFPNVGKKTIKVFNEKDASNLKNMLNDIFSESERLGNTSKYDVKNLMVESPIKFVKGWDAFTEVSQMDLAKSFSKYPEMKTINGLGEKYTKDQWRNGGWEEVYSSKEFHDNVIKHLIKRSAAANAKFNGLLGDPIKFAEQVYQQLGGMDHGQRKRGGHIRRFNIEEKVYDKKDVEFGLSGWINGFADLRVLTVFRKADTLHRKNMEKSIDAESGVKELVYEGPSAYDMIETKMSDANSRRILHESEKPKLHEVMSDIQTQKGKQAKEIHDGIRQKFTNKEGGIDVNKLMETVSGKKMKNLPVLVLPETISLFVGDKALAQKIANKIEKKSNLDGEDIKALQNGLNKWIPMFAEYVNPQGFITKEVNGIQVPGETTNVPRKIQAITHTKRSIAGVTTIDGTKVRSKENFFGQYKKTVNGMVPVEVIENLREAIGIMKDGTRNLNTRNNKPVEGLEGVGETLKGVISLTERMFTSQGLREPMMEMGKIFEPEMLAIADGKSPKSFSKVRNRKTGKDYTEQEIRESIIKNDSKILEIQDRIDYRREVFGLEMIEEVYGKDQNASRAWLESIYIKERGYGITDKIVENLKETSSVDINDAIKKEIESTIKQIDKGLDSKLTPEKFLMDAFEVMENISEKGIDNTYNLKSKGKGLKLLDKFKHIDQRIADFVFDKLYTKELLYDKNLDKAIRKTLQEGLGKGKIVDVPKGRGPQYEQALINIANKVPGIEVLSSSVAEGGVPDLHIKLHGKDFFVEVKMANAQHGSVTVNKLNTKNGKALIKKGEFMHKEINALLQQTIPGIKAMRERLMEDGVKWNDVSDPIPELLYEQMVVEGYINGITAIDKNFNIDNVSRIYNNKPGYPNYYINIQGKGLHYMGKNPLKLNIPMLSGKAILTLRPSVNTIYKTVNGVKINSGFKRISYRAIPTIVINSVKRSNHSIGSALEWADLMKSPEVMKLAEINRVVNKINKISEVNITRAIENIGIKNYSKLKGRNQLKDLINVAKATNLGRLSNKKTKGMSAWDFDDTLAYTKGGVRARIPNTDGKPKPNRKVVFLAGGAGSGKGNVIKKLNLEKQGFKVVNSDISLEWLKKNNGLPENMNEFTKEQRSTLGKLQSQARQIAKNKMMKYKGSADGVVVDGTGGSIKAMEKLVNEFKDKGYDVSMVFVETSLKTALERNRVRKERSLLDKIVEKNHEAVQGNKSGFKTMFGERFMEIKTDKLKQEDAMPTELVDQMNDFVSGYEKIRLDAEQFATQGKEILDRGGEFDFSEFNVVTGGQRGPFFDKALSRAKKYGTKDQFILTARPPEAAGPIHEFLKSQGLDIPLENITGLGNSTGEAKAMWMLEKFSEGYNDMYFADDAMRNVEAVKNILDQLDIKSKVQQAKTGHELVDPKVKEAKSLNDIKNVDRLGSPENYDNIKFSRKHRTEYEKTLTKHRPDLVKEGLVAKTVDNMFDFVDRLAVLDSKKRKYEQITTKWLATSNVKLGEDAYKIKQAVEIAEKHKEDIFSYRNPNELIEKYAGKVKEKVLDPNKTIEFSPSTTTNKKHGITEHKVDNTKEGQQSVRDIIDSHWGKNSNPWCITQAKDGKLTGEAFSNWEHYSDGPKSIVFQNGKLLAFKANEQYWDRMDSATDAPVIQIKEGRVTKKVELVPIGGGKAQEFVMETRTVSKDKKTVTTEIFAEKQADSYEVGTKIVENRVNGITVKSTRTNVDGTTQEIINFDKSGKATSNISFVPDGSTTAINRYGQPFGEMSVLDIITKKGDLLSRENVEGNVSYYHGQISLAAQGIKSASGITTTEIGWKMPKNLDLQDFVTTSPSGKIRADLKKILEVDPNAHGIPSEKGYAPVTYMYSRHQSKLNKTFNKILEESKGIGAEKTYGEAKGRLAGSEKGKYDFFGTPGIEDFSGLVEYAFAGKGKQGEAHKKFFEDNLQKPFNRAYNEIHTRKQNISVDYKALREAMPKVKKRLNDKVDGIYTVDQAVRIHLWDKAGFDIPGLSKTDLKKLTDYVRSDAELVSYADQLSKITMLPEGYIKPKDYWLGENITADMNNVVDRIFRKEALAEFMENRKAIFGEWKGGKIVGENMNKIEAIKGSRHREALENMLWRMENMTNRAVGADSNTNKWMNWVNNATGTIMFFNQKSAMLQTISAINYVNGSFNNPFRAAQAFANQPQYWKDFMTIFNSDMLLQRRSGLKINIEAAELIERVGTQEGGYARFRAFILEKGFIPTKYADSFAIASGGATYYRNAIRKYKKQGLSEKEAAEKAWEDFAQITEATQQSSRPDLISMQQASGLGRPILAFANTPIQMFRRHKRRVQDIANNRGNRAENIASALYYGFAQTMIFSYLANAMFAMDDESDDPEDIAFAKKKKSRHINTIADSYLRGMGTGGAAVAALKNGILRFFHERERDDRGLNPDYGNVVIDMLNVSPPIGSKARKLYGAGKSYAYDREVMSEMGFRLDNPAVLAIANVISATTNLPADRVVMKLMNIKDASNNDFETWQRIAMLCGINKWALGAVDEELEAEMESIEKRVKKEKKDKKKKGTFLDKQKEEIKEGKKKIMCAAVNKRGERCNTIIEPGSSYCTIHIKVAQRKDGKKVQCKGIKTNKKRCGMMTSNKSGFCYYHD